MCTTPASRLCRVREARRISPALMSYISHPGPVRLSACPCQPVTGSCLSSRCFSACLSPLYTPHHIFRPPLPPNAFSTPPPPPGRAGLDWVGCGRVRVTQGLSGHLDYLP
jgi:hypothetical protein